MSDPFDEETYLANNPDVAEAVKAGLFGSGREHFDQFGRQEGRSSPPAGGEAGEAERPPAAQVPDPQLVSARNSFPIVVNSFNQPTYLQNMVNQLLALDCKNILILDQASSSPRLTEYLDSLGGSITVIKLAKNHGPHWFFTSGLALKMPQYYAYTDCDIFFGKSIPDDFVLRLAALTDELAASRIGLAIDISNPAEMVDTQFRIDGQVWTVASWESQYWVDKVPIKGLDIFRAPVDTTFAVYNRKFMDPIVERSIRAKQFQIAETKDCYRIAGDFTSIHMPWMNYDPVPAEEWEYFNKHRRSDLHDYMEAL